MTKAAQKGAWSRSVNHLNFSGHQPYLWNGCSYSGQILYTCTLYKSQLKNDKSPLKGCGQSHVTYFKFWGPNDISQTAVARVVIFCGR